MISRSFRPHAARRCRYDTKCDVHAERFTEAAAALEKHGMRQLGYTQINVDAGWALPQRDGTTHELVADPRFFPRGMANLSADLAARGFQLGGYTDRGAQQCGPSAGSKGYEKLDAELFASWNLSYVKSDDCNATLEYGPAMADYDKFATALAAAGAARGGAEIYFLICGCKLGVGAPDPRAGWEQCPRDASKTRGIAAWRIASDDYMWPNILLNANIFAGLTQFGSSGKFNDPDMLINQPMVGAGWPSEEVCPNLEAWKGVRKRGFPPYSITPKQARLQMALWCTMGAPLILSMNIRNLSDYDLETYSNAEAIAVDQCPLVLPGVRLQGYNLSATAIAPPSPAPPLPNGSTVIANYNIVQGQCDACSRGPTGCCVKGAPNPLVQYLSHKKAMTLVACESLCRTWPQRDHRADNATAATTTTTTATAASTASSIPSPRCHSFVWNSKNYDCFGRLDNAFDASNPRYSHSPGLFSGRLSNESVAAEVVAAAVGADGGRRTATAAEEELARGDSEPPPPPPPFGKQSYCAFPINR